MNDVARQARVWAQKWRWYERNSLPWNRALIHWEMLRREAFVRWPVHGNVLEALRSDRLQIGSGTLFEPGVWINVPGTTAPAEPASVPRMGSIPHGTTINLEGVAFTAPAPLIADTTITPFKVGSPDDGTTGWRTFRRKFWPMSPRQERPRPTCLV